MCGLYTSAAWYLRPWVVHTLPNFATPQKQNQFIVAVTLLCTLSFIGQLIFLTSRRIRKCAGSSAKIWENVLAVLISDVLKISIPIVALRFVIPLFGLNEELESIVRGLVNLILIGSVGYIVARQINLAAEKLTNVCHSHDRRDSIRVRTIYTQVSVLRKVALAIIFFLTAACMLMSFASLRHLGASLLASAGVIGVVAGIAAQRSLGNLLAGFQIALTQPILLDDYVCVEGEKGFVEEITLSYVVVRTWDLRRVVVPISYFIEKTFQNWSRASPELIGAVTLHVDYRVPIDRLRLEFHKIVESDPLWNRRIAKLEVTNTTERSVEVRFSASAEDPVKLSDLQCNLRERLVELIREKHPESLPIIRVETASSIGVDEIANVVGDVDEYVSSGVGVD